MELIMDDQQIIPICKEELLNFVLDMKEAGCRLVQISCTRLGEIFELNYSFAKEYNFINLKLSITDDVEVPSITSLFQPAFLYENEIHDLFGINIKHISIDYKGELYKMSVKKPFGNSHNSGGEKHE